MITTIITPKIIRVIPFFKRTPKKSPIRNATRMDAAHSGIGICGSFPAQDVNQFVSH